MYLNGWLVRACDGNSNFATTNTHKAVYIQPLRAFAAFYTICLKVKVLKITFNVFPTLWWIKLVEFHYVVARMHYESKNSFSPKSTAVYPQESKSAQSSGADNSFNWKSDILLLFFDIIRLS